MNLAESNVFILINLGCEMLYVIEQRLKAQAVAFDKSIQVMRDITCVLLDPKFVQRLILGSQQQKALITPEHCKMMLHDIACCSLMRLDEVSMSKLWDLMTMIYKWQLYLSEYPQQIIDITFRHLDGIGRLYPDVKKAMLIDYTKNNILDFWKSYDENAQQNIYETIMNWTNNFNVKISILIRLGFQGLDSALIKNPDLEYLENFIETAGENIYYKSVEVLGGGNRTTNISNKINKFDKFYDQLNVNSNLLPDQMEIIKNSNLLFNDFELKIVQDYNDNNSELSTTMDQVKHKNNNNNTDGFVHLKTARKRTGATWESIMCNKQREQNDNEINLKNLLSTNLT